MTVAFAIATVAFSILGYRYASSYGILTGVIGAIGGVVLGFLVMPIVFLFLMVFIHVGVKVEDWFHKRQG